MTSVGQHECVTQNRVIALFRDRLDYSYVGDWTDRDGNSNIEDGRLSAWLTKCGYTPAQISAALHKLRTVTHGASGLSRSRYADRFVLKGAMFSMVWFKEPYRDLADVIEDLAAFLMRHVTSAAELGRRRDVYFPA